MTLYDMIYESLEDRVESGELTIEEAQVLNELAYERYTTEGAFSKSPLKDMLDNLKKIKDAKPDEYSDEEDVKKFVDKHYNDIVKASELLEKEPSEITKNEKNMMVSYAIAFIGYIGGALAAATGAVAIGGAIFIVSCVWLFIAALVYTIISYARANCDLESMKSLSKIKKALKSVKTDKLPDAYKKKISKMIEKINDAETDLYAKLKEVKESSEAEEISGAEIYNKIYESLNEKLEAGELTFEQADQLNKVAYNKYVGE